MFQFARLTSADYEFIDRWRRITDAGFSHSEIRGSKAIQRLTAAYRSRSRPSSTPGAKASTVNSYYLDGERPIQINVQITKLNTHILALCSFQGPPRRTSGFSGGGLSKLSSVPTSWKLMGSPVDVLEKSP